MKTTVVRYKVKADRAEENIRYIERVFEALQYAAPKGLRYMSLNLEDGVSFIHIAIVDDELESNPLTRLEPFKEFTAQIRERCEEPPAAVSASIVGNYRTIVE